MVLLAAVVVLSLGFDLGVWVLVVGLTWLFLHMVVVMSLVAGGAVGWIWVLGRLLWVGLRVEFIWIKKISTNDPLP